MFDFSAYIPDILLPQYEAVRDSLLAWLKAIGVLKASSNAETAGKSLRLKGDTKFVFNVILLCR